MKDNWTLPLAWGEEIEATTDRDGIRLFIGNPHRSNYTVFLSIDETKRLVNRLTKMIDNY